MISLAGSSLCSIMGVEAPVGQQVGDLVVLAPAWGARCGGPYCLGQRLGVYLWVAGRADAAALDVRALQQREHIFWTCPHAQAAVDVLAKNLPPGTPVLPQHVWLLVSPCPSVNKRVWWVACLCTLNSMLKL